VILSATIRDLFRRALRGVAGLLVVSVALSLLAAPLHRAIGHDHNHDQAQHSHDHESQPHHCPVCALVKGQVETPDFSSSTVAFVRAEVVLPIVEISCPASSSFDLLPPGRAPPISVIPS
jgi:ABC-type nickel/cobalt efflux system permease component RcnA